MAEVVFLTGVEDPLDYAAKLIRKKQREGARVAVYAPAEVLRQLDNLLWAQPAAEFTPHVLLADSSSVPEGAMLALTRVWLVSRPVDELGCDTAVNLGAEGLSLGLRHARVAEVIGTDAASVDAGRHRWKRYVAEGAAPVHRAQR